MDNGCDADDLLPTAADLAGLDKSKWPVGIDGISAVPTFMNTRTNTTTQLSRADSQEVANRFLYYEFCHSGMVNGLLPQQYAQGCEPCSHKAKPSQNPNHDHDHDMT
jgi:arylsulfatase A-like enzyme